MAAATFAGVACAGEQETASKTEVVTETVRETDTVVETETGMDTGEQLQLAHHCDNAEAGFSVSFPGGWHTNPGDVTAPCSYFHPEEFELPEAQEVTGIAISIRREPVPFDRVTGEDLAIRVLESEETQIDGRRAVQRETESTGEALFPEGVRGSEVVVDLDGDTLIASTYDVDDLDYARNREVLDAMADTLSIE